MKIKINILKSVEENSIEAIFQLEGRNQNWVWVNRENFFDLISNILSYGEEEEEKLYQLIEQIEEKAFLKVIGDKMKEIGWREVNQRLFSEIQEGFNPTKDIETYVFVNKKYFSQRLIAKLKELQWILKAMAVDAYQHMLVDGKGLEEIYKENFEENSSIIEEILIGGEYTLSHGRWRYNKGNNTLIFYKNEKSQRQWSEGNANFIFYDLSI